MIPQPIVLVFGCNGQVGTEVSALLRKGGYTFQSVDRSKCDLSRRGEARDVIRQLNPRVIINCAAYTAVDKAESEPELADAINAAAPAEMAEEAERSGAIFVHYSTDYVFNGENQRPWTEEDLTAPLNVYGHTKLKGEGNVIAVGAASYIFRTSWVYGNHGKNFLLTMLKYGAEREELAVIGDQIGAPTWSRNIAQLTIHLIQRFTNADGSINLSRARSLAGVYHATSGGETSWHGFASAIFEEARLHGIAIKTKTLREINTEDWPAAARRPKYSVMSNSKLNLAMGFQFPDWREGVRHAMRELSWSRELF